MNGTGHQLFACTAFSLNQNTGFGVSHLTNSVQNLLHRWTPANDFLQAISLSQFGFQPDIFLLDPNRANGPPEKHLDPLKIQRLGHVVISPPSHGIHGSFDGAIGSHHHTGNRGLFLPT